MLSELRDLRVLKELQVRQGKLVPLAHNRLYQAQQEVQALPGRRGLLEAMEVLGQQEPKVWREILESREMSERQARRVLRVRKAKLDPPEHKDLWDLLEQRALQALLIPSMFSIRRRSQKQR